jgi:hypothetical protein
MRSEFLFSNDGLLLGWTANLGVQRFPNKQYAPAIPIATALARSEILARVAQISGTASLPTPEQIKDPVAQKVISCYKSGTFGGKTITIDQMHECADVWITPHVLLACAFQAHCSVLEDTIAGRATLDSMLEVEKLNRNSILTLPADALHLPTLPTKESIDRCKKESVQEDFVACVSKSMRSKFEPLRACFEALSEGERLACFAKQAKNDARFSKFWGCFAGANPSPDKLVQCITPQQEWANAETLRNCVHEANNPVVARSCITAKLSGNEKNIAECVANRSGTDFVSCLDGLSPNIAKARDVLSCLTGGGSRTQQLSCVSPKIGGDPSKIADCLAKQDRTAAAVCIMGDKPEVHDAMRLYGCASSKHDASTIIANCSEGLIKDAKTRETLACVSQSGSDQTKLTGCVAGAFLPQDAARLVGCASTSQGPTQFALCAAGPAMNEEWRIAAECAANTGGNPVGFAGCTAGRLTLNELTKCFESEFRDCYGPNNTIVKGLTNAFYDLTQGPGENNEIKKAIRAVGDLTGGPNSVINKPEQLLGGPNSIFNNPSQIWGGPRSVFNDPSQVWGGDGSVFNDPGQVFDFRRW